MKLVSFATNGDQSMTSGIQTGAGIANTSVVAALTGLADAPSVDFGSTRAVVALAPSQLGALASAAEAHAGDLAAQGALHAIDSVRLGPPIIDPQKIICIGLNYRDHAEEAGLTAPSVPMFFAKFQNSLAGPTDPIVPPRSTSKVDYEGELAVVIGQPGRNIPVEQALDHVAGAMVFNDVSARDLQMANNLWTGGKAIDTFGPCGPAVVTVDEIPDLQSLSVRTHVNGQLVQDGNTASMIFSVAELISFLSEIMTLEPGDIIATGTPAGIGAARTPPLFLHPGDVVEVAIDGLGALRNRVTEAA